MTARSLLENYKRTLQANVQRHVANVEAVFDDDLWPLLDDLGLLAPLDKGELRCHSTGVLLNRENVGGIVITPEGPKLVSEDYIMGRYVAPADAEQLTLLG